MLLPDLEAHRPDTVEEALSLLENGAEETAVLAGGTELLVDLKQGTRSCNRLISLAAIAELHEITLFEGSLRIGAMVRAGDLQRSPEVKASIPELIQVSRRFAAPTIQNRATIGGNLVAAVPSADFPPLLIALGAEVEISGREGRRWTPLRDFFAGPRQSVLTHGELLTMIRIPPRAVGTGLSFHKLGMREALACAVASAAAMVVREGETVKALCVVLGAVAPTPLTLPGLEADFLGRTLDGEAIAAISERAAACCQPIDDTRGSAEYRRHLARVLSARALREAWYKAGEPI